MDQSLEKMDLGRRAFLSGDFASAAQYFSEVMETQGVNDVIRMSASLGQMESLLLFGELDQVESLLEKHFLDVKRPDRRERRAVLMHIKGKLLRSRGDYESAIEVFREELSMISTQSERSFIRLTQNYLEQANVLLLMNKSDDARVYLDLANCYVSTDQEDLLQAFYYLLEAEYFLAEKKNAAAKKNYMKAHKLFLNAGALWWASELDQSLMDLDE